MAVPSASASASFESSPSFLPCRLIFLCFLSFLCFLLCLSLPRLCFLCFLSGSVPSSSLASLPKPSPSLSLPAGESSSSARPSSKDSSSSAPLFLPFLCLFLSFLPSFSFFLPFSRVFFLSLLLFGSSLSWEATCGIGRSELSACSWLVMALLTCRPSPACGLLAMFFLSFASLCFGAFLSRRCSKFLPKSMRLALSSKSFARSLSSSICSWLLNVARCFCSCCLRCSSSSKPAFSCILLSISARLACSCISSSCALPWMSAQYSLWALALNISSTRSSDALLVSTNRFLSSSLIPTHCA
mmetsp:Transcript_137485/g.342986  ORF Transcript_137485/g.342986 Transcript_137485/m.342986 type:complete len:300 (+) Transcript_137485:172-1071(+)